jgi:hypothetical protein
MQPSNLKEEIEKAIDVLKQGVDTRFSGTHAAKFVEWDGNIDLESKTADLSIIVDEGKYRMVRRMLANVGLPVLKLHRTRIGPVTLNALELKKPGDWAEVKSTHLIQLWKYFKNIALPRGVDSDEQSLKSKERAEVGPELKKYFVGSKKKKSSHPRRIKDDDMKTKFVM